MILNETQIVDIGKQREFIRNTDEFSELIEEHMGRDACMLFKSILAEYEGELEYYKFISEEE